MGQNAVGPVALIAAGIYLGYLTITGRAANFAAFLASGGTRLATDSTGSSTTTGTTTGTNAQQQGTGKSTLSSVTNPYNIFSIDPKQLQLINSQLNDVLTTDPSSAALP